MITFVLAVHIIVVMLLIVVILLQQGRGGGLIETFAGAESIFGTKTSSFFVRLTVILGILFFATSVSLAWLSKKKAVSVVEKVPLSQEEPAQKGGKK